MALSLESRNFLRFVLRHNVRSYVQLLNTHLIF